MKAVFTIYVSANVGGDAGRRLEGLSFSTVCVPRMGTEDDHFEL